MDDPRTDPREIRRAFRFIRWTNRRLRGVDGLLSHLEAHRHEFGSSMTLLDVGTGCGDIPLAALQWAKTRGIELRVVAIDSLQASIDEARREVERTPGASSSITLLREDAFSLEQRFEPRSFDVVHAGMFLHHFTDEQVVSLLSIMGRLASKFVIWNDLSRDMASRVAIRLITLPCSRVVRHDAVLSVDKGFLESEREELIRRASLPKADVRRWTWSGRFSAAIPIGASSATPGAPPRTVVSAVTAPEGDGVIAAS